MSKDYRIYTVRFPVQIFNLMQKVAVQRGEDVADLVRRGVLTELAKLSYLDADQKKALGVAEKVKHHE